MTKQSKATEADVDRFMQDNQDLMDDLAKERPHNTNREDDGMELKWKKTERGFDIAEFKDTYQKDCSVQVSSCAEPRLWVGCGDDAGSRACSNGGSITKSPRMERSTRSPRQAPRANRGKIIFMLILFFIFVMLYVSLGRRP